MKSKTILLLAKGKAQRRFTQEVQRKKIPTTGHGKPRPRDNEQGYKVQPNALERDERTIEHKTSSTGVKKNICLGVARQNIANFHHKRPN